MILFFVFYLIAAHEIRTIQTLECYSCSDEQDCGTLFSPNSSSVEIVKSPDNAHSYSCSISVTPEGLTTRDIVRSYQCRSSPYQFCCNENLCNSLPSPPLPALTSLKCAVGKCVKSNGVCIYETSHVTVLSSATESCSITFGEQHHRYYKKACQPTISAVHSLTVKGSTANTVPVFCCNSPECNTGVLTDAIKDVAVRCYTCDSRITGLAGCMHFNESSPHVYKAGSSSKSESCATIVGFKGRDPISGKSYPDFAIRTFIPNCVNKPKGRVSYGGAYFEGIIECCSTHYCNSKTLHTIPKKKPKLPRKRIIIGIAVASMLLTLAIVTIILVIYLCCKKPSNGKSKSDPANDPDVILGPLLNKDKQDLPQEAVSLPYPEPQVAPKKHVKV